MLVYSSKERIAPRSSRKKPAKDHHLIDKIDGDRGGKDTSEINPALPNQLMSLSRVSRDSPTVGRAPVSGVSQSGANREQSSYRRLYDDAEGQRAMLSTDQHLPHLVWVDKTRTIRICYDLAFDFAQLYRAYVPAGSAPASTKQKRKRKSK
jgi:hypothetical protein